MFRTRYFNKEFKHSKPYRLTVLIMGIVFAALCILYAFDFTNSIATILILSFSGVIYFVHIYYDYLLNRDLNREDSNWKRMVISCSEIMLDAETIPMDSVSKMVIRVRYLDRSNYRSRTNHMYIRTPFKKLEIGFKIDSRSHLDDFKTHIQELKSSGLDIKLNIWLY